MGNKATHSTLTFKEMKALHLFFHKKLLDTTEIYVNLK